MTAQVIGRVKLERVSDHARSMVLARYYAKEAVKQEIRRRGVRVHEIGARFINEAALAYLDQHRDELITKACAALTTFEQNRNC
jgi:hypothetical protein